MVASSKITRGCSDKIKTDGRDTEKLTWSHRAWDPEANYIPETTDSQRLGSAVDRLLERRPGGLRMREPEPSTRTGTFAARAAKRWTTTGAPPDGSSCSLLERGCAHQGKSHWGEAHMRELHALPCCKAAEEQ